MLPLHHGGPCPPIVPVLALQRQSLVMQVTNATIYRLNRQIAIDTVFDFIWAMKNYIDNKLHAKAPQNNTERSGAALTQWLPSWFLLDGTDAMSA